MDLLGLVLWEGGREGSEYVDQSSTVCKASVSAWSGLEEQHKDLV